MTVKSCHCCLQRFLKWPVEACGQRQETWVSSWLCHFTWLSWFLAQVNGRVIPAVPTWVGGVHSHITPEGAHPASHTTKALLPSSPGALLPHTSLSSGLTPITPALTQSGRTTGLQPLPSSPGFCPHPVALCSVVAHVTRSPMDIVSPWNLYPPSPTDLSHYLPSS